MCSQPLPQPELGNKSVDEHDAVQTESPRFAPDYSDVSEKQPTKTAQTECRLPASPQLRAVLKQKYT